MNKTPLDYHNPIKETKFTSQPIVNSSYSVTPVPDIQYAKRKVLPRTTQSNTVIEGFGVKVSVEESAIKNSLVRVVDSTKKVIGERPPVKFSKLSDYRNMIPQLDTIIGFETDMIVGTDMNINSDDDEALTICDDFARDTALYDKIKNITKTSLTTGFGLMVRGRSGKILKNIEEFDVDTLKETYRDSFGNTVSYVQDLGGEDNVISGISDYIPIIFKKNNRSAYGLSEFHAMAISRRVGNRDMRPLVESFISLDDVVIGTLENFAFPIEYHTYVGANRDQLLEEARKYKEKKPGDVFFIDRPHEIDRREPTKGTFVEYIDHFKNLLQHGTGFPLDMLTGDFASRASSQTADSFFMRKIKSYQKYITKIAKSEIFEELLRSLGWDEDRIAKANITIEFETEQTEPITGDLVLRFRQQGDITPRESRDWLAGQGMDLDDEEGFEKILQDKEDMKDNFKNNQDNNKQEVPKEDKIDEYVRYNESL